MNKKSITMAFIFIIIGLNTTHSRTALNIGYSSSSLYTTDSSRGEGLTFGATKTWPIQNSFFVLGGVLLTHNRTSLPSTKKIRSYLGEIEAYHISIDLQYFETITLLSYFLPNTDNIVALHFGPSLLLETNDYSQITMSEQNSGVGKNDQVEYDYRFLEDSPTILSNSGVGINIGASFFTNFFEIRVLYSRHLSDIYWIKDQRRLKFQENIHDFKLCLGIKI